MGHVCMNYKKVNMIKKRSGSTRNNKQSVGVIKKHMVASMRDPKTWKGLTI